ncbi:MAG: efflux RND transporter periplasmic adaptor subunit [Clostridiales bacterium]|nr:efflux RND transporter periplasmic adaptor subunit [Clostridiales bacterium]
MKEKAKAVGKALWRHKIRTVLVLLVVAVVLVRLLTPTNATAGMTEETAELRDITTYNSFVGNVEADTERSVLSQASAEVLEVLVEEGDTVEEGDVIATLDTSDVEYTIAQMEATLASTQTANEYNIKDAQTNYDNAKEALDSGLNSSVVSAKSQMDSAKEAYETAKDTYNSAKSQIDNGTYSATASYYTARSEAKAALETAESNLEDGEDAVAACEAALEEAQAALEAAQADETITDLSSYELAVTNAQTDLTTAQTNLTALEAAVTSAESAYETAKSQFNSAKKSALSSLSDSVSSAKTTYENAKTSYEAAVLAAEQQLETYENALEKTEATADTTTSELELQNLYDSLEDYTITAPCSGTVTELNISEGDMATSGVTVATISNLNAMTIAITVDEYSIINTSVGSDVTVYVDSIDSTYEGTLTWIADTATISNGVSYYEAEVSFTADDLVRSGMSVEVRLTNVDEKDVVTISVDSLNYNDDNTAYVYTLDEDGNVVTQTVTLGVSDGSYVQITDGLEEGDSVFLAGSSDGTLSSTMESRVEMVSGVLGAGD